MYLSSRLCLCVIRVHLTLKLTCHIFHCEPFFTKLINLTGNIYFQHCLLFPPKPTSAVFKLDLDLNPKILDPLLKSTKSSMETNPEHLYY